MSTSAKEYHSVTSYSRDSMSGHYLDWANMPNVFKTYPGIKPIPLIKDVKLPEIKLSELLKRNWTIDNSDPQANALDLSGLLALTYSLTGKSRHSGGDFYFRNVASAGALYPTEVYVATHGAGDRDDGLFHFSTAHHGLSLLREMDIAECIVRLNLPKLDRIPLMTFFLSAIFFRSAWKYRERSFRYHLLDTGHVLEHLMLALKAFELPCFCSYDFDANNTNRFLGVHEKKEAALAICGVPGPDPASETVAGDFSELNDEIQGASQVSSQETGYPIIMDIHNAGKEILPDPASDTDMTNEIGPKPDHWIPVTSPGSWPEIMSFSESVFRRRSKRNFVPHAIEAHFMQALLDGLCQPDHDDTGITKGYHKSVCTGFLVRSINEFEAGFYLLDRSSATYGLVKSGYLIREMTRICLDQAWLANAAAHFLFMTNLEYLEKNWGNRGYRYALLTAGRLGERLYLNATAMGLGCCGIGALYDGEAAALLNLNEESRLLYLVAVGPIKG